MERFDFEGLSLPIPGNYDEFFTGIAGKDWRKTKYKGIIRKETFETIFDTSLPFEEALAMPHIRKALRMKRFKFRPIFSFVQRKRAPIEKKATWYRRARVLSARRFYHWEQLYPVKEKIAMLAQSESAEAAAELEILLDEYIKDIVSFAKKHDLGLFIDQTVFDAAKPLIIEKQGHDFFEKYERSIPEKHRIDIDVYLKNEEIEHPLLTKPIA